MRNYKHLSLRYIWNRLKEIIYQRSHKDLPWLTRDANMILSDYLLSRDVGMEFGGGRSTIWFARRIKKLVCIEENIRWHEIIVRMLAAEDISNVDCRCVDASVTQSKDFYFIIRKIYSEFGAKYFDFILVDGICRDICAFEAVSALKPGGILIIDNVNRYLPSSSTSPHSRSHEQGPDGALWSKFLDRVSGWRCVWTSSGVTDTAIFFKPQD
jgi:hypothetical protein